MCPQVPQQGVEFKALPAFKRLLAPTLSSTPTQHNMLAHTHAHAPLLVHNLSSCSDKRQLALEPDDEKHLCAGVSCVTRGQRGRPTTGHLPVQPCEDRPAVPFTRRITARREFISRLPRGSARVTAAAQLPKQKTAFAITKKMTVKDDEEIGSRV